MFATKTVNSQNRKSFRRFTETDYLSRNPNVPKYYNIFYFDLKATALYVYVIKIDK